MSTGKRWSFTAAEDQPGGRPPRNPDYQRALKLLLHRGRDAITRIAIASSESLEASPEQRTLFEATEIAQFDPDELALEVGRRLAAWPKKPDQKREGNRTRRLRIETRFAFVPQRFRLRKDRPGQANLRKMQRSDFELLTHADLQEAIDALRLGIVEPEIGSSTEDLVLLHDGIKLSPEAVVGLALATLSGESVTSVQLRVGDISNCCALLVDHGFDIVPRDAYTLSEPSGSPNVDGAVEDALGGFTLNDEDRRFAEGSVVRATHLRRERNSRLVGEFKAAFVRRHGRFHCERCRNDWVAQFGPIVSEACFEVHHRAIRVADMDIGHESRLEDLQLLCANCHRAVHREMKLAAD